MPLLPAGDPVPRHGFRGDVAGPRFPRTLTIAVSRQAGARGSTIARQVGQKLGWQVVDQDLVEYMVRQGSAGDHIQAAAREWVETRIAELRASGMLGQELDEAARVILALGATGEVIIVGRGAGLILPAATTLHVRFVAPRADRVAYFAQWLRLTPEEAEAQIDLRDARRTQYLLEQLNADANDPTNYDLVLNSSRLGEEQCAEIVARAAKAKSVERGIEAESEFVR
ncbi:MAG: AAA family ATPase [Gemmataceae bacterium]